MAKVTTADAMVERLIDWGVDTVFGIPGDGINGIMEAFRTRSDRIRFVQTRHEEAAAFAACGYAKFTGRLGVCVATSGPGGIHLLNGLYDAKLDGQPVLAITGLHYSDLLHTHGQQDVDLDRLFMDVCVYNARVMGPTHILNVTDLAVRTALGHRGVSHITIPVDFQSAELDWNEKTRRNQPNHTGLVRARRRGVPPREDLRDAAAVLNRGRKIAILAGRGALGCDDLLEEAAERLGAPVAKALLGIACLPDDSPYTTGSIGLLGTTPSQESMENCDTLFIIGSSFPYLEFLPEPGQARAVQIDIDPARIGLRYPVDVGLVGDTRETLELLLPMLKRNRHRGFLKKAQKGMDDWWELMETRGTVRDTPMKPQVVAWELGRRLREDAIITCDSGTIATWFARQMPVKRGQLRSLSGTLATMAPGLPYAIAAQVAYPDRQVVAFVGDGGFSMLMADFVTAVKYRLPIKVVIVKNDVLGQIKWEQMVFLGNPQYAVQLAPIDFAAFAQACGGVGYTVSEPDRMGEVLDAALAQPGPAIIEAVVDPHEPPMPPKIKARQARKFAEALLRGQPYRGKIAMTVTKDKVRELI